MSTFEFLFSLQKRTLLTKWETSAASLNTFLIFSAALKNFWSIMRVKIQIVFALARVWNCQFMAFLNPYDFICRWIRDTCYLNMFPWLWVGCLDWLSVAGWFTAPLFLFSLYILHICYTLCFSLILAFEESFFVCRRRHNGHFSLILSNNYEAIFHSKSMKLISFVSFSSC